MAKKATSKAIRPRRANFHLEPGAAREALLNSAINLLNAKGAGHVSLNDVARDAKLNPALVKYYFGNKDHLFRAVIEHIMSEWRAHILGAVPAGCSPTEELKARSRVTIHFLERYPYLTQLVIQQMMGTKSTEADVFIREFAKINADEQRKLLQRGVREGEFRKVDPMLFFFTYIGISEFFFLARPMLKQIYGVEAISPKLLDAFIEHTIDIMLHGIAKPAP
jgi:TetR/AcrR family transcriptional regulator